MVTIRKMEVNRIHKIRTINFKIKKDHFKWDPIVVRTAIELKTVTTFSLMPI